MTKLNHAHRIMNGTALAAASLFATAVSAWAATPLGTAFTYQGQLKQSGTAVNDTCDCQFSLWDDPAAGTQVGPTLAFDGQGGNPPPLSVANGLFTVELGFGAGAFNGEARWLQIAVACPSGGALQPLAPRQPLTAAPYALFALEAANAGDDTHWTATGDDIHNTNAGNVGIGTSAPQVRLQVGDGYTPTVGGDVARFAGTVTVQGTIVSDAGTVLSRSSAGQGTASAILDATADAGGNTWYLLSHANANPFLGPGGAFTLYGPPGHAMTINAAGRVGIGTTSPGRLLDVNGSGTLRGSLFFDTPGTLEVAHENNTGMRIDPVANSVHLQSDNSIGLTLTHLLKVGIGTTDPDQTLHVHQASAGSATGHVNAPLVVENNTHTYINLLSPDASERGILFGDPGSNADGGIIYNSSGTPDGMQFRVGGNSTRMALSSTGNLGIGTMDPAIRLAMGSNGNGIHNPASNSVAVHTSGLERMRINSVGDVRIGASSGTGRLYVHQPDSGYAFYVNHPEPGWAVNMPGLRLHQDDTSPNVVGGYSGNTITTTTIGAVIGGGGREGAPNTLRGPFTTIAGGEGNTAGTQWVYTNEHGTVGGGQSNIADGMFCTVAGGRNNRAGYSVTGLLFTDQHYATVGGGLDNTARGTYSTIPGGRDNTAMGHDSFAAGRRAKANHWGAFVWADRGDPGTDGEDFASTGENQFLIRATGGVGIGTPQPLNPLHVSGAGTPNGGVGSFAEVVGCFRHEVASQHAALAVSAAPGRDGILYLGEGDSAHWGIRHNSSAGRFDIRSHQGGSNTTRFTISSTGNVGIGITTPVHPLHLASGAHCTSGGTWTNASSRQLKERFTSVDGREVLSRVAALPIHKWNYKAEDSDTVHMGPTAEDFAAAFGLGADIGSISTVDADGVALAAIQGLYEIVKEKDAELQSLRNEIEEIKDMLRQIAAGKGE